MALQGCSPGAGLAVCSDLDDSSWAVASAPGRWTDQGIPHDELTVVVYRKTVRVPAEWKGRAIGISAWFYPGISNVRVNGQPVDPQGPLPAMYAEVSALLRYGEDNTIVVATTGDGVRELAETDPPLLGPLGQKSLTRVVRKDVVVPAPGRPMAANLFFPGRRGRPADHHLCRNRARRLSPQGRLAVSERGPGAPGIRVSCRRFQQVPSGGIRSGAPVPEGAPRGGFFPHRSGGGNARNPVCRPCCPWKPAGQGSCPCFQRKGCRDR